MMFKPRKETYQKLNEVIDDLMQSFVEIVSNWYLCAKTRGWLKLWCFECFLNIYFLIFF